MGKLKAKLMGSVENLDSQEREEIDMSDEYDLLLPKGMRLNDFWQKVNHSLEERHDEDDAQELGFDLD